METSEVVRYTETVQILETVRYTGTVQTLETVRYTGTVQILEAGSRTLEQGQILETITEVHWDSADLRDSKVHWDNADLRVRKPYTGTGADLRDSKVHRNSADSEAVRYTGTERTSIEGYTQLY